MSECNGAPAKRYLELYLRNTLPIAEAKKFEEHYYGCEVCLSELEALESVELKLGRRPRKAPASLLHWPGLLRWPTPFFAAGAVAAVLLICVLSWRIISGPPAEKQQARTPAAPPAQASKTPAPVAAPSVSALLSQLADLNLPVFELSNMRGEKMNPALEQGMKAYDRRDCPSTVRALSQVDDRAPEANMMRLYSGVCLLHDGDPDKAVETLKSVNAAAAAPEQEAAWYYLAQIALVRNDGRLARHYLTLAISSHGDFEDRARAQLRQIPANESRR